jgi:hypothetical protein
MLVFTNRGPCSRHDKPIGRRRSSVLQSSGALRSGRKRIFTNGETDPRGPPRAGECSWRASGAGALVEADARGRAAEPGAQSRAARCFRGRVPTGGAPALCALLGQRMTGAPTSELADDSPSGAGAVVQPVDGLEQVEADARGRVGGAGTKRAAPSPGPPAQIDLRATVSVAAW